MLEKLGVGGGLFHVREMAEGKVEVEVGVHGFEEGRGGERVGEDVNGERDI